MFKEKGMAMLILVLLAIAGCAQAKETSPTSEVIIGPEDNGNKVVVNVGDTVRVSLPSNPSTGYTWEVAEMDEKLLRQVGEIEFEPESDLPGAPGKQILSFEVVGEGQSTLKLVYHRPWEKDVEPAKEFSVQVVGRPASTGAMVEPTPKKGSTKPAKKFMHLELPK